MQKSRVEAFSDGVLAIIVTIMVLEIKVPHQANLQALIDLWPVFLSYILSFAMVLIYWNNHHHLFQSVTKVNGHILLANGLLLFFLSLLPFASGWMGENHFESIPVVFFGIILWLAGFAYFILTKEIIKAHGPDSLLAKATNKQNKETISLMGYSLGITVGQYIPIFSCILYAAIAIMWLIPDKRIENAMK
ncbi:MAG: TMEM175 family protein [Saprospiraceae bacterium]